MSDHYAELLMYVAPEPIQQANQQWLARSGGFLVQGYGQLISRHGLKAIDSPRHPFA